MEYAIKETAIGSPKITLDGLSIDIDVTIWYGIVGDEKCQSSSIGTTINLFLDESPRNTLVSELNTKILQWFNENYNS
jgi:hypothetical protein